MLTVSEFGGLFSVVNKWQEHVFKSWIFEVGMGYGDSEFWWPSKRRKRATGHEGVDFFCYEDGQGNKNFLGQALVPAPCDGKVIAVCRDFLGESVFIRNADVTGDSDLFVLAHLMPQVEIGQVVSRAEAIGVIAQGYDEVPGHLHVSALQGDWRDLPQELNWPNLNNQKKLKFVEPFTL